MPRIRKPPKWPKDHCIKCDIWTEKDPKSPGNPSCPGCGIGLSFPQLKLKPRITVAEALRQELQEPTNSQAVQLAKNPTGGVYLIQSRGHFKIGKANNFEQRIRQVNLELPEKAVEIHRIYTDDTLGIESYWHKRFKEKRKNGEWFELTEEDVEIFKARTRM